MVSVEELPKKSILKRKRNNKPRVNYNKKKENSIIERNVNRRIMESNLRKLNSKIYKLELDRRELQKKINDIKKSINNDKKKANYLKDSINRAERLALKLKRSELKKKVQAAAENRQLAEFNKIVKQMTPLKVKIKAKKPAPGEKGNPIVLNN